MYGSNAINVLDLTPIQKPGKVTKDAKKMARNIRAMHEEVGRCLHASNAKYKEGANRSRWSLAFDERDLIWVLLREERFPIGTYSKLKKKKIGPCRILKKINDNAYKVNLPSDVKTSNVFNVEDLTPYKGEEPLIDILDDDEYSNSRLSSSQ